MSFHDQAVPVLLGSIPVVCGSHASLRLVEGDSTVLDFASYLFHDLGRSTSYIACHFVAIADPLLYRFGFSISTRSLSLIRRGFFITRPPPCAPNPTLSLNKVVDLLQSPEFLEQATPLHKFQKALFLIALPTFLTASSAHKIPSVDFLPSYIGPSNPSTFTLLLSQERVRGPLPSTSDTSSMEDKSGPSRAMPCEGSARFHF